MITFGTSAYLKLLALNPQPRDTEIRNRIQATRSGGYDFHKAMRRIATEFASMTVDWSETRTRLKSIKQPAERKSATGASFALARWVGGRPIRLLTGAEQRTYSPNEIFSVRFTPDFELEIDGLLTRVHVWNTKAPPLRLREAIGALGLFTDELAPRSIAVLSLRTGELFTPADYISSNKLAKYLALDIERRFVNTMAEYIERRSVKIPAEKRPAR